MQASSWIDRPDCLRTISNTRKRVSTNLQTLWSRSKGTWLQLLFSSHMLTPLEICHLPRCSVPVSCVNGLLTAYMKLMFAWSIFFCSISCRIHLLPWLFWYEMSRVLPRGSSKINSDSWAAVFFISIPSCNIEQSVLFSGHRHFMSDDRFIILGHHSVTEKS